MASAGRGRPFCRPWVARPQRAFSPTASASKSRPDWPSAPATTPPPAAASWRSTGSSSADGHGAGTRHRHRNWRARHRGGQSACTSAALASDIDLRAVRTARENARLNRVGAGSRSCTPQVCATARFRARAPFAIVFANILLAPLKQLAGPIARLVAPGGLHRAVRTAARPRRCPRSAPICRTASRSPAAFRSRAGSRSCWSAGH